MRRVLVLAALATALTASAAIRDIVVTGAPFPLTVREWTAPAHDFRITDYGAKPVAGDFVAAQPVTEAVEAAIAAAAKSGGGRVVVPAGEWKCGAFALQSNVALVLEKGAVLHFPDDPVIITGKPLLANGRPDLNGRGIVNAVGCSNVAIMGEGTFKCDVDYWYRNHNQNPKAGFPRPKFFKFSRCKNVRFEGFKIRGSPSWTMHFLLCEDIVLRGVDSVCAGPNTDGIDLDSSRRALVENCSLSQTDNTFTIKSGMNEAGRKRSVPTEEVVIRNCRNHGPTVLAIGSEISGGVRNIFMTDCVVDGNKTRQWLRVKTNEKRGGYIENVWLENVRGSNALSVMDVDMFYDGNPNKELGKPGEKKWLTAISGIHVKNVECDTARHIVKIRSDAELPPKALTAEDIRIGHLEDKAIAIDGTAELTTRNLQTNVNLVSARVAVDLGKVEAEIPTDIYGLGMEDVNHEIYGGLDAQRLYGESFEEPPLPLDANPLSVRAAASGCWDAHRWPAGELIHDTSVAHWGKASQLLVPNGTGVAVINSGLGRQGIPLVKGRKMRGAIYARGDTDTLAVRLLCSSNLDVYAEAKLKLVPGKDWQRIEFTLTPNATDSKGRFMIVAFGYGKVWVDDAYLADEPTNEFGRLGCREDVVAGLREMGVNFLRWGGTMCNAEDYLLKNFDGTRKPYRGFWHQYSSGGFGPREFLRLAAALKLPCALSISAREDVDEAVRFAEELKRHAIPITVEIGNEECIFTDDPETYRQYCALVKRLVPPMRAANPKLTFAHAAWWTGDNALMEETFRALDGVVEFWDLHPAPGSIYGALHGRSMVSTFLAAIRKWNPDTKMRAAVFEENGNRHDLERALGHALMLEEIRAAGSGVLTSCPANAFQVLGQNDNGWNQGNVFMTPSQVWLAPCAWAQRMASDCHRPLLVASECDDPDVHVSATRDRQGRSPVIHFVNVSARPKAIALDLMSAKGWTVERAVSLADNDLEADNSPEFPQRVAPAEVTLTCRDRLTLKPFSYTVITLTKP